MGKPGGNFLGQCMMFRETEIRILLEKSERRVPSFRDQRAVGGKIAHAEFGETMLGFTQKFARAPAAQVFFRQFKSVFYLTQQIDSLGGILGRCACHQMTGRWVIPRPMRPLN